MGIASVAPEVTHHMALIPLVWCLARKERRAEWWWIAAAFGISWVADTLAHFLDPWLVSAVYPVSQAAIIGAVLLSRDDAKVFLVALVAVALFSLRFPRPDLILHTVAWLSIVGVVWSLPIGRLRIALLVAFGLGWVAWLSFVLSPTWATWGAYQSVRALGLGMFCWASVKPHPMLRAVA